MDRTRGRAKHEGTVVVVDDEPEVLEALRVSLRRQPYQLLCANSARDCLAILEREPVDVVVSDERMPEMTGSALLAEIEQRFPHVVSIMLTGHASLEVSLRAINEGRVFRILQKPCPSRQLREAISAALQFAAERRLGADLRAVAQDHALTLGLPQPPRADDPLAELTSSDRRRLSARELEVLEHLVRGRRVAQIAPLLFISKETVRNHLKSLFGKLGAHSQAELIDRATGGANQS